MDMPAVFQTRPCAGHRQGKKETSLHAMTAAVFIKLYNHHNYLMKSDVTNMQYYK
jgi:hypothetical protein